RPKILLMDEPTSSMDAMTETLFLRRLKEATKGQTLIIVTHRMSVLSLVERLIVLEDGHVVKDGAKDRVMESLNENVLKKKQTMHSVEEKQQEQGVKG
ncbi:type I secretion system permease/ATPase, partial [Enterobacter cloacae complex sp. 743-2DZ2F-22B]